MSTISTDCLGLHLKLSFTLELERANSATKQGSLIVKRNKGAADISDPKGVEVVRCVCVCVGTVYNNNNNPRRTNKAQTQR